ncbi:MAG TPA: hypothetical protein P5048_02315 [Chlamydiales bacterium]|nr:hypothetical protein [Chlamydiales bacterium]
MKRTFKITILISEILYHIADIGIVDTSGNEGIYYHPKENIRKQYGIDITTQKIAGRLDHISFHADGTIHTKYKEINRSRNSTSKIPLRKPIDLKIPGGLLPTKQNQITPLIIDSVYQNENTWLLPSIQKKENLSKNIWSLEKITEFSILSFLVDKEMNHINLLKLQEFNKLYTHQLTLDIPFLQKWKILFCLTWQTMPEIFPESLANFDLYCDRQTNPYFPRNIIAGPTPLAFEHLFFGRSILMPK